MAVEDNPYLVEQGITVFGKPVFTDDETGESYSEVTETIPLGEGFMVIPTINPETGDPYDREYLTDWYKNNGNVDPYSGEKLPVFESTEEADKYAQWRSDNMFNASLLDESYWSRDSGLPFPEDENTAELSSYIPTWREKTKYAISDFFQDTFGVENYNANKLAEKFTGNENASWDNGGIGLLDFTPAGAGFGTQEAKRDFRIAKGNDDKLGMGLAVGEGILNVAEAIPLTKVATKPLRMGAESLIDLAKRVEVNPNTVGSLGGNVSLKPKVDTSEAQAVLDIRAAQMDLAVKDRIQPSGENPLFDLSPESYTKTLPEQKQTPVPRRPDGSDKPLPKGDRGREVNESVDAIAERLAERMKPWLGTEAQYFYHTGPIVDKAMSMGFKKEEVYDWMREFADAYAATSPRTETAQNIRNATLVMTKRHLGIELDEIIGKGSGGINEKGYPMMIGDSGIHRQLTEATQNGGINPNTNPKPATFAENVYGNLDGVTVDTHAIRGALDAMNEINPGSIPIDYIKPKFRDQYKADPLSLNPANMIDDSMGSQMIDGTKMQTEYAVFSDIYRLTAEKLGVSPAEAQSMGWFGSGDSTGLASELKSVARLLDERIDVTAQALNESKESVFKKLLNKEIPVLSLFGAATGAGLMSGGEDQPQLARGGFLDNSESEKGIMSIEGQSMADEKFRLDRAKADLNNDGKLSSYEQARGEAVQKAIKDDKPMKAYHGGMPCGCEGDCDGSCGGEGMMPGSYYDTEEETGNPVPVGSLPEEVADDISAFLSEGEYVLPSDVVRWHGLKHIQDMMVEAKAGLMSMDMMGQLHDTEGTGEEYEEEEEQGEEEYETPEGNDVEVATVETEEEVLDEDEDEEAKTVSYAFKSTPKVAFIR
jgi:Arc/MetJ-type ribon-helix-helix transcriptional regulator